MSDLDAFWNGLDRQQLENVQGWRFTRDGEIVYVSLPARDKERYRILFLCGGYNTRAPDPVFVDDQGSKMTKTAWPRGDSYFDQYIKPPPHCFVCMPLSRTGIEKHPEWLQDPTSDVWDPKKHSLLNLVNFFSRLLNEEHYAGRLPL